MSNERPAQTRSEKIVADALRAQLHPGERLLEGVRISDPVKGDIEIDFLLLMPGVGAAVIEVKGGVVSYTGGEWFTKSGAGERRIKPIEQARNGKHALRAYLMRQPEWHAGLLKTEWFVAMPFTSITGDMGPEGRRELLLGADDLSTAVERIRQQLMNDATNDLIPDHSSIELAYELLLTRQVPVSTGFKSFVQSHPLGFAFVTAALATIIGVSAVFVGLEDMSYWVALAVASLATIALGASRWRKYQHLRRDMIVAAILATIVGTYAGVALASTPTLKQLRGCSPNYVQCLPIVEDLDCDAIEGSVKVSGPDVYRLDRDGDGIACEWNEPKQD